jgi:DNA-binding LacI/PurR family transcriptional regulator
MPVTVIDVAKEAGVSRTTVSNVFSGHGKFSEDTRRAVLEAAHKLGYRPNLAARSLITNQSRLIGLILPSYISPNTLAGTPFYNTILDSIYMVLRDEAYYDLLVFSLPAQGDHSLLGERIDARNVDGILAIGEHEPDLLGYLETKDIPVVLIDNYSQDTYTRFSYVNSDDAMGGYLAAKHLIEKGYRKIGLCALDLNSSPLMRLRQEGYQRALEEHGLAAYIFAHNGSPFDMGVRFADQIYRQGLDAAFCTEDMLAVGVLHRMLELGVPVGKEFGLVGFDNVQITTQVYPQISTIDQQIYQKGETAAIALLDILKKTREPGLRLKLPVHLVARQTA